MIDRLRKESKYSIRVTVGVIFVLATVITASAAVSLQYYFSSKFASERAIGEFSIAAKGFSHYVNDFDARMTNATRLMRDLVADSGREDRDWLRLFSGLADANNEVYSVYYATQDERFYQVINLNSSATVRERIGASPDDRWAVISVIGDDEERIKEITFYDQNYSVTGTRTEESNYYPTQRPWYRSSNAQVVNKTKPYLFQHLKVTGQTFSMADSASDLVVGVDVLLSSLSQRLMEQLDSYSAQAYVFNADGEILASNESKIDGQAIPHSPPLALTPEQQNLISQAGSLKVSNQASWAPIDYALSGQPRGYAIDLLNLIATSTGIPFEYINGFTWNELLEQFQSGGIDMLHSLQKHESAYVDGAYSQPLYNLDFGVLIPGKQAELPSLKTLSGQRIAILSGWSIIPKLKQDLPDVELVEVPDIVDALRLLQDGKVAAVIDSAPILQQAADQYFLDDTRVVTELPLLKQSYSTGFHLVLNEQHSELIEIIDLAINNITHQQWQVLDDKWLKPLEAGAVDTERLVPYPKFYQLLKEKNQQGVLVEQEVNDETLLFYLQPVMIQNVDEYFAIVVPKSEVLALVNQRTKATIWFTSAVLCLLLPLIWRMAKPIVNPINALKTETEKIEQRQYGQVQKVDTQIKELWELSKSICEMSSELQKHEKQQEEFIESFIRLIAQAIDDKSAYTAGHCNRVPEIAMMLAKAAERSDSEALKDFKFKDEKEEREFRIAAWLHDCGKITQPEHIVDKGTKLETNYNRIHEVRMRFEVLWRDAEIKSLQTQLAEPENAEQAKAEREKRQRELQDDFTFVAGVNIGGEFIDDHKLQRIKEIANQTWLRHFDNRLGLSQVEEMRFIEEKPSLPVAESLLSDRPEHLIQRERDTDFDPRFGINVQTPEYLYNLGEVYNLSVARGTLTAEDRYKINEHMISGIKMLGSLPFPDELKMVPRYATTHHETLKGTGYPRKLSADELTTQDRIIAIADIFEALTAADRPYKKGKPLSVAIDIMHKMALDRHIDMELFKLFLTSKTYLAYAEKFLAEGQLDEVDVEKYVS
ncbi:transporter substrate-binding domain-containing protein [Vibrio astriarenae]|uniref:Transporter substrate-binding domain-containing protein n=1 Tax=Vibrio astriarenae TaxID=1481923 RepID=A0A7Z2T4T6_9VIBR|nr:HD domain-containing phosphohydrolase [Vibrio astriarenae]QIA64275.1 transporter substrate-binding domain-containing protein [Vibrio astriarenae]